MLRVGFRHLRIGLVGLFLLTTGFAASVATNAPSLETLPVNLFLHGGRYPNSPNQLYADPLRPGSRQPRYRDSRAIRPDETSAWVEIASWPVDRLTLRSLPETEGNRLVQVRLDRLGDFQGWLALGPDGDPAAAFDVRVDFLRNGSVVSSAAKRCVSGLVAQAQGFTVPFESFAPVPLSLDDQLQIRVWPRAGSGDGGLPCNGGFRPSALRFSFDTISAPSNLKAWVELRFNGPPVAVAGPDQTVPTGSVVQLDGTQSSDPENEPLTYLWSFVSLPSGSQATLDAAALPQPAFTADVSGRYELQLVVNDGVDDSDPDTVVIDAGNRAPVANAGPDQTVPVGETVQLDGTDSTDDDGDPLTYNWSFVSKPAGSSATLSDSSAVRPTFVVDVRGEYGLELVVNDGRADSPPDAVLVTTENTAPVAHAGPDQTALVAETVTLDGTGSTDIDGDPLTYAWALITLPAGSAASLNDPTSPTPSFVADLAGDYVAQLIVNDGHANSAADAVTVSVSHKNLPPIAEAGPDQPVRAGDLVTLDGSASHDPELQPLTYHWSLTSKPVGSQAEILAPVDLTSPTATFVADLPGHYVAQLIVNDGELNSAPDTNLVTCARNTPPVADPGPDQRIGVGETVTLDGTGSTDIDGDPLTFSWALLLTPDSSTASLSDPASVTPTFVADLEGLYVAQLIVNDGRENSAPETVNVTVVARLPIANAGPDQGAYVDDPVRLDGSNSTCPTGDTLTYSWIFASVPPGSGSTIDAPNSSTPTFVPDLPGDFVLRLVVSCAGVDSTPDTVTVAARLDVPVAYAGVDRVVAVGARIQLDGTGSYDPGGRVLTYRWTLTKPAGSLAQLSDPNSLIPTFTADLAGSYTASLVVNNGSQSSAADDALIVAGAPPVANAGADQDVPAGFTVQLDGRASYDPASIPLTYFWSLVTVPVGSIALISDPTSPQPTFVADVAGNYDVQLVVGNGTASSLPDVVRVTAGEPQIDHVAPARAVQGETVPVWVLTGRRLQQATSIAFDGPGAQATGVLTSAEGTHVEARLQVDLEAPIGPVGFHVVTPYGISNAASLQIEPKGLGWIGTYYDQFSQQDLNGLPIVPGSGELFSRTDPAVQFGASNGFAWHPCLLPGTVCVTGPFTVRWEGLIYLDAPGSYLFGVSSSDAARLHIGGQDVVLNPGTHGAQLATGTFIADAAGSFAAVLEFDSSGATPGVDLLYRAPGAPELVLVPPAILFNNGGATGTDRAEASVSFFNPEPPPPPPGEASIAEASVSFFNPEPPPPPPGEASIAEASASFFNPEPPPAPLGEANLAEASVSVFNPELPPLPAVGTSGGAVDPARSKESLNEQAKVPNGSRR